MASFPNYKQTDEMTCGPTCLRIIASYYGRQHSLAELVNLSESNREGTSLQSISTAAEKIGFRTLGVKIAYNILVSDAPLPCIAYWNQTHFLVIYKITKNTIYVSDPAHGLLQYSKEDFIKNWASDNNDEGVLLLIEPKPQFYEEINQIEKKENEHKSISFIFDYLKFHKKAVLQIFIGLLASSFLQLIVPFLSQSVVDIGIQNRDLTFIYLILFAQLMVFFGRISIEIIRNFILIHVSSRVNINLVSDFIIKLMKLPISYFDSKMTGDIMQRINDNHRIEAFLTGSSLNTLFSTFNFIVFSGVLAFYSLKIFLVFLVGSILYFLWISFFLKRRSDLDYKRFNQNSQNQSKIIELISGMQEIKLFNAERYKRWQWEALQVKLFKINLKSLSLTSAQNSGSSLINELKNIIISFLGAKLVLDGEITLGMLLSISYIIGQLNAPVLEMVNFVQHWQDAKISLERLGEIHSKEDEEPLNNHFINDFDTNTPINLHNVSFKYEGIGNEPVLKNISITIPNNKITAIVGSSGSGKTTLMKLLLKFYIPSEGNINLENLNLEGISSKVWRDKCGVVMQEGYIFNDTIANNIAVGVDIVDTTKLKHAAYVANIKDMIHALPLGYNTKIGNEGMGISTGQKQRILIARAIYKNPDFLFFDEATSALDSNNERVIMNNLNDFFKNKTVVVIAHRLSTVKNADQIIVLDKGTVIEVGNHFELTALRGAYYELVKNQLELGN